MVAVGQRYPWITFSAYWASGGSPLTIFGHQFAPGEAVAISKGGTTFANTTADSFGDFTLATQVPYSPAGPITIVATGGTSGVSGSSDMTVAPVYTDLQLGSYAGAPGSMVQFIGNGYVPNDVIEVRTDRTGSTVVATFSADSSGHFSNSSWSVPAGWAEGNLVLTVTGANSFDTKSITYYVTGM